MSLLKVPVLMAGALWIGAAQAQTPDSPAGHTDAMKSADSTHRDDAMHHGDQGMGMITEAQFLWKLHHANQMEIEMGKVAKSNSSAKDVKDFADQMIRDHQRADDKVQQFAKDNQISITEPAYREMPGAKSEMDRLKNLKGTEFDSEFAKMMVRDHQKVIHLTSVARDRFNTNTKLVGLTDELLPTLRQHLAAAEKLEKAATSGREKTM